MAWFITGSRPRRAVVVRVLVACALAIQAGSAIAQQTDADNAPPNLPVSADDGWSEAPCGPGCGDVCCGDAREPSCGCASPCATGPKKYCYGGWVGAEWLRWRLDGNRLPPLVTDGPATTPQANVARLDDPDTQILSGDERVNDEWRNGFRISAGIWLNCCHTWGLGGDYFNLGDNDYNFFGTPETDRVVGRPFFNTETGADDAELVSVPDQLVSSSVNCSVC